MVRAVSGLGPPTRRRTKIAASHQKMGSQPSSPLLALPAELRNSIYSLVLLENDIIDFAADTPPDRHSLLRTCTTIRDEASKIYYGVNRFLIGCTMEDKAQFINAVCWLRSTQPQDLAAIEVLLVELDLTDVQWSTIEKREILQRDGDFGRDEHFQRKLWCSVYGYLEQMKPVISELAACGLGDGVVCIAPVEFEEPGWVEEYGTEVLEFVAGELSKVFERYL